MQRVSQALRRIARLVPWPVRRVYHDARRWRRGHIYGWARPPWWPDALAWPGPRNPHEQQGVVIFVGSERCEFAPAIHGPYRGHVHAGTLRPDAGTLARLLTSAGLPSEPAPAMALVSSFEGGFDAIQTYDRGKFAWGFVQFTITGGLPRLLEAIAREAPREFDALFRAHGIDLEAASVVLRLPGRTLRGRAVHDRLHDDPAFWAPFVRASRVEAVQRLQVKAAFEHYYRPALATPVSIGGRPTPLASLFADQVYGRAVVFDRAVNRGVGHVRVLFEAAAAHCHARSAADAEAILACVRTMEQADGWRLDALAAALAGGPAAASAVQARADRSVRPGR